MSLDSARIPPHAAPPEGSADEPVPAREDGAAPPPDLSEPRYYLNREVGLLEFNQRVLALARDPETPVLERLRFLTISSTNLDEFFEVRVAGLREQVAAGVSTPSPDGLTPKQVLAEISRRAHEFVDEQYRVLNEELGPALEAAGITLLAGSGDDARIRSWVQEYFQREVYPVLTPVGLDPAHPFPMILNKSLNFIVALEGRDAFGRSSRLAIVQAPRLLPRLIAVPPEVTGKGHQFIKLSTVILEQAGALFPGMRVTGCYSFRVTRNSDLWVDEEEVDDLLRALLGELRTRNYGEAVRLELSRRCPRDIAEFLLHHFRLDPDDLYLVDGPVNLHRLSMLHSLVDRPDLKYRSFVPATRPAFESAARTFAYLKSQDILLHHPYDSFMPVVQVLQEAARDPDVLAIKVTLYRTGSDSPMATALVEAARNGKEVTAVIELRARFDEAANIDTARRFQEAGVKVVYGVVGYKAHAKMMLIVRREPGGIRRYAHLGTGNYHIRNTTQYTDLGLFTADEALCSDVHQVFQQLTGLGRADRLKKLVQSPFGLHRRVLDLIDEETAIAGAGRPARIQARVNALIEPEVIRALYRASQAGVQVDLIVRGTCCLRPGVPGVSENIRVRSVLGRFLEHSRVYHFLADGKGITYGASADWMPRNFFRRVEVAFPIEDERLEARAVEETLALYFADTAGAFVLQPDGSYRRARPTEGPPFSAQAELLRRNGGTAH